MSTGIDNIYMCFFCVFCLLCAGCGAHNRSSLGAVTLPAHAEARTYTLWYSHNDVEIPFLAGLEHDPRASQPTHRLALVLLQGKRFAQCVYKQGNVTCTLDAATGSAYIHNIADTSARLIAHGLNPAVPLPRGWEEIYSTEQQSVFKHHDNNMTLRISNS